MKQALLKRLVRLFVKPAFSPRLPIPWRRRWLNIVSRTMSRPPKQVLAHWQSLGSTPTYVATPPAASTQHILYLHGGGYVSGGHATHGAFVRHLAAYTQATVWMPQYRLAPEHPYPAALDDAVNAYQELHALLSQQGEVPAISIMGDSAGGGLALACTQTLRELELKPASLVLLSPWVDLTCTLPSYTERATRDPMLQPNSLHTCAHHYSGGLTRKLPGCSPLFGSHKGLPPLLIQVGSEEILYDDAAQLTEAVQQAGSPVTLDVFEGMWHVFQLHVTQLAVSRDALERIAAFLASHTNTAST